MRRNATLEEKRAYQRAYYAKNKAACQGYALKWRLANKEPERERSRIKYQKNKERIAIKSKVRYEKKREEILMKERKRYQRDKLKVFHRTRIWRLKRNFGITVEQYDKLLHEQGGVCAICKSKGKRLLGVDHCHGTGKVRGLLCHSCNIALGLLKDSIPSARAAVSYLEAAQ